MWSTQNSAAYTAGSKSMLTIWNLKKLSPVIPTLLGLTGNKSTWPEDEKEMHLGLREIDKQQELRKEGEQLGASTC
jgi:hypothetical protein